MTDEKEAPSVEIPHDIVNEQIVIAAVFCCSDEQREKLMALPTDLFLDEDHIEVWSALRELHRCHESIDMPAAVRALAGTVEASYIRQVIEAYPDYPANMSKHLASLRWDSARAETVNGPLSELLRSVQDPTSSPDRVRALSYAVARSLDAGADHDQFIRSTDVLVRDHMAEIDQRRQRAIYPYGIEGLDADDRGVPLMIPGAAPGSLTVITGISGSAKSTMLARIMLEQARRDRRGLYGAWEQGAGDTLELMATMSLSDEHSRWTRTKVSTGDLDKAEAAQLRERMEAIGQLVRFFDVPFKGQRKKISNDDCLDVIHQAFADYGADVGAMDLWERAIPDRRPEAEANALFRTQEIAEVTRSHMLLVAQQRLKDIETRDDKRPTREGIKGSAAYVEVADTILGTHRPSLFSNTPDVEISIPVLKQRWGRWPTEVRCDWDGDRGRFLNGREVAWTPMQSGKKGVQRFTHGGG